MSTLEMHLVPQSMVKSSCMVAGRSLSVLQVLLWMVPFPFPFPLHVLALHYF